jgi:hypothetical protein
MKPSRLQEGGATSTTSILPDFRANRLGGLGLTVPREEKRRLHTVLFVDRHLGAGGDPVGSREDMPACSVPGLLGADIGWAGAKVPLVVLGVGPSIGPDSLDTEPWLGGPLP